MTDVTDLMPIIRVRRKRSADPHAALIMETKKRKEDPLLFSLFKTEDASEGLDGINGARVIEFKAECTGEAEGKGLEFIGEHSEGAAGPSDESMGDVEAVKEDEPVRYDYYKIYRGSMTEPIKQWDSEDIELRFATEEEQTLLLGNSDSESDCVADDDDDSNDENNWRNDYPDEDPDEDDDDDDTEDEDLSSYDEGHRESVKINRDQLDEGEDSPFALERMRRRLEGFAMGHYEGGEEDNSDDDNIRGDNSRSSTPNSDDGYDYRYRED